MTPSTPISLACERAPEREKISALEMVGTVVIEDRNLRASMLAGTEDRVERRRGWIVMTLNCQLWILEE